MKIRQLSKDTSGNITSLFSNFKTQFRSYDIHDYSDSGNNSVSHITQLIKSERDSGNFNLSKALGYFNSMIQAQPFPSVRAFNHLLGAISNLNHYSTVVSMHRVLTGFGNFRPNICTYEILTKSLLCLKRLDLSLSIWGTIIKSGIEPNVRVLSALLHGLCNKGSVAMAAELLKEIDENQYPVDGIIYAVVINGFCRAGESRKAVELIDRMCSDERVELEHSVCCFNPVIDHFCKKGKLGVALIVFRDMIHRRVSPNVVCYNILIRGFSRLGHWREVRQFLMDMDVQGISPDVDTCTTLISSLTKRGKTQEALSVFGLMTRKGINPDAFAFTSLISGLCKSGKWKDATRYLEGVIGFGISLDIAVFNAVLDARLKEGIGVEALLRVGALIDKGLFPEVAIAESLLLGGSKETDILVDAMVNRKVYPDIQTFNIILNAMSNEGLMEEAQRLVDTLIQHRRELRGITYNILIKGYSLRGEMDKAKDVFDRMRKEGIHCGTISYNILANGYIRAERVHVARKLLTEMVSKGLLPDKVTRHLMKNICRSKHFNIKSQQGENYSTAML